MSHVVDELSAWLDGALTPATRQAVEAHLGTCAACRAERDRLQVTLRALARLTAAPEPSPFFTARLAARLAEEPRRGWLARLAAWRLVLPASGLAAATLGGLLMVRHQRGLELGAAAQLELLEEFETIASVDDVETAEDAALIAHLDTLERGGSPVSRLGAVVLALALAAGAAGAQEPAPPAGDAPAARERWEKLSAEQREALRQKWKAYQALTPEKQAEVQEQLARLQSLPPEQRAELMKRYEAFRRLPEREQRELQERFARFKEMSPERRAQIRKAMGEILRAPPREREQYLENLRRWRELSPEERERARARWRERRGP